MTARGALIKPWLFREAIEGHRDLDGDERLAIYHRYVTLALEHWRDDERGRANVKQFLVWHLGFWCRYAPRRADGSWPSMQGREDPTWVRTPLEALLARTDAATHEWLADHLMAGDAIDPATAPASAESVEELAIEASG